MRPITGSPGAWVSAYLGAHMGGPCALHWSQDGRTWQPIFEGRGNRAWCEATVPDLQPGRLLLRVSGTDVQLEELVVTFEAG